MKRVSAFITSPFILFFVGMTFYFVGCDKQPLEPISDTQTLSKKGGVPAEGNDNKFVLKDEWTESYDCGDNILEVNWNLRAQFKVFNPKNKKNVALDVYHIVITFTNESGDKFVYRDVGPDRWYWEGDEFFVAISGRSSASGTNNRDEINLGHAVMKVDPDTWQPYEVVFIAGQGLGNLYDLACAELN
jgi:hypothetical protein